MDGARLEMQLRFLAEVDKMKSVLRQTLLIDKSRRENDAEHSWHFALMAMVLHEYADPDVSLERVLKMALVHDLVEVYAGDTFAYDAAGNDTKAERESTAALALFGLLPDGQGAEMRALWEEFDAMETADARYASAVDRLQPFLANYMTDGHTWRQGGVAAAQVYARMEPVRAAAPALWPLVEDIIRRSAEKGYFR